MPPEAYGEVAAYQRLRLREIRGLYSELDLELNYYLNLEHKIGEEVESLKEESSEIREMLSSLGAALPEPGSSPYTSPDIPASGSQGKSYGRVDVERAEDFQELVGQAESYLSQAGVDLNKDPLLQVLSSEEISRITEDYGIQHGDVSWDSSDYLAVMLAGFVATLLDIFLVRIPTDQDFLGKTQQGSPLTKWLREHSEEVHERFLKRFEDVKVPYDDVRHPEVPGMRPKTHRLQSFGHDPILGFIFGVIDILGGTGTYIDKYGDMVVVNKPPTDPVSLTTAFLKAFLHLLSDVCTKAGIQPPFFTLLQLIKTESPFVLGPSGERVSWTNVARYMYTHGYDLRHFATMGIVPASVEMVIRGWRLCESYEKEEDPELTKVKTTSMLMLGHTMATSGNLLKTGAIYGMNPLAMNWAQALWMFPVTISWVRESVKRDRALREKLDAEWMSIYQTSL